MVFKRENNQQVQSVVQQNEYQKSIQAWREQEHQSVSWLTRIIKTFRRQEQTQSAELELFRDSWEWETGLDSHKEGKARFASAVRVHLERATKHRKQRLANEALAGSIEDFADDGQMGEEPDFEAEILKQQPEFKQFKK